MQEKILEMYILIQMGLTGLLEDFCKEENGDSNMVAVIVLIVIVIAIAVIFNDAITEAAENIMDRLTEFVG